MDCGAGIHQGQLSVHYPYRSTHNLKANQPEGDTDMKRPYITQYFETPNASGKKPASTGYAATLHGARRNMAVRIVLGQYGLAIVAEREKATSVPLCTMRRTTTGLSIKEMQT
jgi:hypothetical protein